MRSTLRLPRLFRRLILSVAPLTTFATAPSCGGQDSISVVPSDADGGGGGGQQVACPNEGPPGCMGCRTMPEGVTWPVDPDAGAPAAYLLSQACQPFCGSAAQCYLNSNDPSKRNVVCIQLCSGRRPSGFDEGAAKAPTDLGTFFADMARLEAASIHAFRALERELTAHRAPRALVRMARRAARDEQRHTRMTRALARRHGATSCEPVVARNPVRPLEAIAIENAVEGCVRETFGALLATYQAENARDPVIREAMARIARDETRHAELSWKVAGWLNGRLDAQARRRVAAARRAAALDLSCSPGEAPAGTASALGLPDVRQMKHMAEKMLDTLWS